MVRGIYGLAAMAIAGLLVCTPAHADSKREGDSSDVLGTWSFQTKPYRNGECMMSGTMYLSPHPDEGRLYANPARLAASETKFRFGPRSRKCWKPRSRA
mgnify:CR=1 FL=1